MNNKEFYGEPDWHYTYIGYQIYQILAKERRCNLDDDAVAESREFMD